MIRGLRGVGAAPVLDVRPVARIGAGMAAQRHPIAAFRRIGTALLLVPFILLSLMGQGVMPRATPQGMTLVLCSGAGPVEVTLDPATGAPMAPAGDRADGHCDWAMAQVPVLPDGAGWLHALVTLRPAEPLRDAFVYTPAHDPRGHFARGPPTLS